jgi:uncharacterized protein (DUF302 family)
MVFFCTLHSLSLWAIAPILATGVSFSVLSPLPAGALTPHHVEQNEHPLSKDAYAVSDAGEETAPDVGEETAPDPADTPTESTIPDAGLVVMASPYSVAETGDRFEALLAERGVTVFARVNHAEGAAAVDLDLRPTEVIIFGNPRVGTPLMQCAQSVAIDLPQKLLIWQNEVGDVYLGYNDPRYLAARHGITGCEGAIARVEEILMGLTDAVIRGE